MATAKNPGTLVLLRHGESTWNLENLFTGWHDVPLSERGVHEAKEAGRLMQESGLRPAIVHESLLLRAIQTTQLALAEMEMSWVPVKRSWRLNERHYGALQGLNKQQTAEKYGEDKVKLWRRSYDAPPPRSPSRPPRSRRRRPARNPLRTRLVRTQINSIRKGGSQQCRLKFPSLPTRSMPSNRTSTPRQWRSITTSTTRLMWRMRTRPWKSIPSWPARPWKTCSGGSTRFPRTSAPRSATTRAATPTTRSSGRSWGRAAAAIRTDASPTR